ncbi:hypothetical protein [Roseiarcus sp.]|uniref:hypothetical protein n=1 Tax=Roseiarcus sp. TaxID=1969460 RepID=UPI003F9E0D13
MGVSLALTGDIAEGRAHYDRAIALYGPVETRLEAPSRLVRVTSLAARSIVLWWLGFPEAALADAELALRGARESGDTLILLSALEIVVFTHLHRRDYATANAVRAELGSLAE